MVEGGGVAYVARLYNQGFDDEAVARKVAERYDDQAANSRAALIRYGYEAYQAGAELTVGGQDESVPIARIPRPGVPGRGFAYTADIEVLAATGGGLQYRTIIIESGSNLTLGELRQRVDQAAQAVLHSPQARRRGSDIPGQFLITDLDVLSIERRDV